MVLRVLAAPDKFRGTADAIEVSDAIAAGVTAAGCKAIQVPMADGGEGTLDALGGANRSSLVVGPLGKPVEATWRLNRETAVIEMAKASGLLMAGGPKANRPLDATTYGTGELIRYAAEGGAQQIIIGMGGSATTDGGLGAIRAMGPLDRYRNLELLVACDVKTYFLDAPKVFAPQKGATEAEVDLLSRRMKRLEQIYKNKYGVRVGELSGGGAAGGLAGGLAAIGATLVSGIDLVAERLSLDKLIEDADLVITGEGKLDSSSFHGKVVGGVAAYAKAASVPLVVVAGEVVSGIEEKVEAVSLVETFGEKKSLQHTLFCIQEVVSRWLQERKLHL